MDLARAPRRRPLTARKKGSGYENGLDYARTFSYPEPVLHTVNRAWQGSRGTRMGCPAFAATTDQNIASEREQNAKCANVMFMRVLSV
jgi:hypothetical protein